MKPKPFAIVATVVIVAGLAIGALRAWWRAPDNSVLRADLDRTRSEVHGLKAEVARLRHELESEPASQTPPTDETGVLRRHVAELEAKIEELRKRPEPAVVGKLGPVPPEQTEADVIRSTAIALDASRPPAERIKALEDLRLYGRISPEVAAAMLQVLETSSDSGVRADILRHLHRSLPLGHAGTVLRALQSDPDRKVREEAAETLGPLKDDASVRVALEHAAQNDLDPDVRAQALKSLSAKRR